MYGSSNAHRVSVSVLARMLPFQIAFKVVLFEANEVVPVLSNDEIVFFFCSQGWGCVLTA